MTVQELIDALNRCDPKAEIQIVMDGGYSGDWPYEVNDAGDVVSILTI